MAYAVPLDAPPRRLPFGQVNDLALDGDGDRAADRRSAATRRTGSATGAAPRAGCGSRPATTRCSPGCSADLDGQLAAPMLIGGRLVFLVRPRGHRQHLLRPRSTAATCAGTPTTTASTRATRRPTAAAIVYHVAGDIWRLDSLDADARRASSTSSSAAPPAARAPRVITAADHLGELDCDETGQASVVEVRGTVHWLTHADGPARALSVEPGRARPAAPASSARRARSSGSPTPAPRTRRAGRHPGRGDRSGVSRAPLATLAVG